MPAKLTARQARSFGIKAKGGNKFNARKVRVGDVLCDSIKEADRYRVLMDMVEKGEISDLRHHVTYLLAVNGIWIADYEADFVYRKTIGPGSYLYIEDVKSEPTRKLSSYRMKKALMLALHGIAITEV